VAAVDKFTFSSAMVSELPPPPPELAVVCVVPSEKVKPLLVSVSVPLLTVGEALASRPVVDNVSVSFDPSFVSVTVSVELPTILDDKTAAVVSLLLTFAKPAAADVAASVADVAAAAADDAALVAEVAA
tara:strand:- start:179 stop:565 length:387 start_codon:yes stop_codon:yes gene_type:complete